MARPTQGFLADIRDLAAAVGPGRHATDTARGFRLLQDGNLEDVSTLKLAVEALRAGGIHALETSAMVEESVVEALDVLTAHLMDRGFAFEDGGWVEYPPSAGAADGQQEPREIAHRAHEGWRAFTTAIEGPVQEACAVADLAVVAVEDAKQHDPDTPLLAVMAVARLIRLAQDAIRQAPHDAFIGFAPKGGT